MTREELTRHRTRAEDAQAVLEAWQDAQVRLAVDLAGARLTYGMDSEEAQDLETRARVAARQVRAAQDRVDYLQALRGADRPLGGQQ